VASCEKCLGLKNLSALVAALAIDLENPASAPRKSRKAHRGTGQNAASHSGKKSKEAIATPSNRPSFDRKKTGRETKDEKSGDEEEGSTRHDNYQASKPDADANRRWRPRLL
jgi:hypothetical protein